MDVRGAVFGKDDLTRGPTLDVDRQIPSEKLPPAAPAAPQPIYVPTERLLEILRATLTSEFVSNHPGESMDDLTTLALSVQESYPSALGKDSEDGKMLRLCLALLKDYQAWPKGVESPGYGYYFDLARRKMVQLQPLLLPPRVPRALGLAEYVGNTWSVARQHLNNQTPESTRVMIEYLAFALNPELRVFIGQWERDYAERLSGFSALQLEKEWQRLAHLRGHPELPLYAQTFYMFSGDTFQSAHPKDLELDLTDSEHLPWLRIAMMDVYLEWASRHWGPDSLGSAMRGIPAVVQSGRDYLLRFIPKQEPYRKQYLDLLAKLEQTPSEEATTLLEIRETAAPAVTPLSDSELRVPGSDETNPEAKLETRNSGPPVSPAANVNVVSGSDPADTAPPDREAVSVEPIHAMSAYEIVKLGIPPAMATSFGESTIRLALEFTGVINSHLEQALVACDRLIERAEEGRQEAEAIFQSLEQRLRSMNPAVVIRQNLETAQRNVDRDALWPLNHLFGNLKVVMDGPLLKARNPIGLQPNINELREMRTNIIGIQSFFILLRERFGPFVETHPTHQSLNLADRAA